MIEDHEPIIIFDDGTARVTVRETRGEIIVSVGGELDVASRDAHNVVLERVSQLVTNRERNVVVNMGEVQFCDSTGIILLLRLQQQAEQAGSTFAVREPSAAVTRVLIAGGLGDLLESR
jgi:anti-sigma B factor antagonist